MMMDILLASHEIIDNAFTSAVSGIRCSTCFPRMARASFLNIQTGRNSVWLKTDLNCIIFDEISIVSADMLDLIPIDAHVRTARARPDQPFCGLQVIMFGYSFSCLLHGPKIMAAAVLLKSKRLPVRTARS
jgi:hypothetical protein